MNNIEDIKNKIEHSIIEWVNLGNTPHEAAMRVRASSTAGMELIMEVAKEIASNFNNVSIEPATKKDEVQLDKRNEPDNYILKYWRPETSLKEGIKEMVKYYTTGENR